MTYMPWVGDTDYIVLARDDLSRWMELRAINAVNSLDIAKFLYEDILCLHGRPKQIIMDQE